MNVHFIQQRLKSDVRHRFDHPIVRTKVKMALETRSEMLYNLERYGKPALRRLADIGVLTPQTVLEHFVWVTDEELAIFADSGAVASNNPGSNLRLSSGICRVRDIMDTGGRIAFGTDGISFSDREDFFQELRLACYLQRFPRTFERQRLDSEAVLRAAAANGARALGLEDRLGSLEPGRYADLLIVEKDRILFPPGRYDAEPFLDVVLDRADVLRHRHGHGARPRPDGRQARHRGGRGRGQGAVRGSGAAQDVPVAGAREAMGRARTTGGAVRHRLLPALVRHADRARVRLQREGPAGRVSAGPFQRGASNTYRNDRERLRAGPVSWYSPGRTS